MNVSATSCAVFTPPQRPTPTDMLKKGDTDGSGGLSLAEFTELGKNGPVGGKSPPSGAPDVSKIFGKLDTDSNGELSETELARMPEPPRGPHGCGAGHGANGPAALSSTDGSGLKSLLGVLQSALSKDTSDNQSTETDTNTNSMAQISKALRMVAEYLQSSADTAEGSASTVNATA